MDTRVHMEDRLRLWLIVLMRLAAVVWLPFAVASVARCIGLFARTSAHHPGFRTPIDAFLADGGMELIVRSLGHVAAVLILIFFSRRIVCWIIPPAQTCPICKYDVSGVKGHRCPECGQIIRTPTAEADKLPR